MATPEPTPDLPDVPQKTCTKCGRDKPETAFSPCGGKKYPLLRRGACKVCHAANEARQRAQYPEKYRVYEKRRLENHGEKRRAASRAYNKRTYPQRREQERAKSRPKERAKYAANPEKYRQKNRRYQKTHLEKWVLSQAKRRARKQALPDTLTHEEWQWVLDYWSHACATCGQPEGLWTSLAMDHVIPLAHPECPGTTLANVLPLCDGLMSCNTTKNARDLKEWAEDRFGKRKATIILAKIEKYFQCVQDRESHTLSA